MQRRLLTLLIFLGFLWPDTLSAQKHYTVAHYTGDNGLPQNSVKDMTADSEGFIWLGTEDGLVRFDGRNFYVYNRFNLGLVNTRVTNMQAVRRTPERSVSNQKNKSVYVYFYQGQDVLVENGKAVISPGYYNRREENLHTVKKDSVFLAVGVPHPLKGITSLFRYFLMVGAGDSDFYLCEKNQISYYKGWKKKYVFDSHHEELWNFFTLRRWLYCLNENGTITGVFNRRKIEMPISGDILKDANYQTGKKQITLFWNAISDQAFLYLKKNFYLLNQSADGCLTTRLLIEDFDLVANDIQKVHYDKDFDRVYFGSKTKGFFVLSRQRFQALTIGNDNNRNVFYAGVRYGYNTILTSIGRVVGKDIVTGKLIDQVIPAIAKLNPFDPYLIARDKNNTLWIKNAATVFHMNAKNDKMIGKWRFQYDVESIHQAKDGKLWLGVTHQGLYSINPDNNNTTLKAYVQRPLLHITQLESKSATTLLVGTTTGLYTVEIPSKKIRLIQATKGLHIKSIHVFNKNQIWITALETGLMLLNDRGDLVKFPMDKEKYLSSPHCAVSDEKGYLWIPTNRGLFQMAIKDLVQYAALELKEKPKESFWLKSDPVKNELFYKYHTKDEGFNTNEFNGGCEPCGVKLNNGYISLPSLNGLVWFKPEEVNANGPGGSIVVDKVEVGKELLSSAGDTIRFPLNPKQVKLHFATAFSGNDYNVNVSYALVKQYASVLPSDWIALDGKESDIRFSSLNSGNYTLLIRKLNGFGLNNYAIKKIYFHVPLFWYETWWAKLFLGVVLLTGVYFYNKFKIRQVKRENARLEEVVERRTQRLNVALVELEESKTEMTRQIHMLSRLLASMTHDVQSPLNYISLTSGGIRKMVDQGNFNDVSNLGDLISDSSKRMGRMLRDLLDYIKIQVYGNRMKFEDIELRALVENKLEILKNVIALNGSAFSNDVPPGLTVFSDYQMLSIVIHNLIDNAAKFTHKGKICVQGIMYADNKVELIISNTATGVPDDLMEMINSTEEEFSEPTEKPRKKTGMGLLIVKEISMLVGVTLKVTQTEMTRFHLYFE